MADRLDVLLGILLDKSAQKDAARGIEDLERAIEGLDDAQLDKLSVALDEIGNQSEELEQRFAQTRREVERLNTSAEKLTRISTILTATGAAIVGGIALSANQYVNFVEKAGITGDETANRWIAASKRVQNAQLNLGQASAEVLLPIYEKAADLAEKAAAFVQRNPELVQAALNTGLVVATLGAVGIAVSKGIRLYADFKYLAATVQYDLATRRFEASVKEYLAGSLLGKGAGGAAPAAAGAAGGLAGAITSPIGITALIVATAAASVKASGSLKELEERLLSIGGKAAAPFNAFLDTITQFANPLIVPLKNLRIAAERDIPLLAEKFPILGEIIDKVTAAAGAIRKPEGDTGLRDFQQEATLASATRSFVQYRQQEAQAEEQYMRQRAQIVEQGAAQIAQIERNYSQQRAALARQFAQSSAQAVSNFNFQQRQAEEQFAFSEAQALSNYNKSRAEQREQFEEEERRSREDHLRELRRLQEDHDDRIANLTAARDALGLVKENRDYARKLRDANEEYNVERARRKQDFNKRAREQEEEFRAERERRRQEFEFRQQQAQEQFAQQQAQAKAQYEERLRQLDEQHRQELEQARKQTLEKLRDLQVQYQQEQVVRRNAFFDILRDLDANLLNEQNIRNQYYARMQEDLLRFLESTAGAAGSNLPGYQRGGYTPEGAIRAHRGEWVANQDTTRALEGLVGGRLTQSAIQGLATGGGMSTVNVNFPAGLITAKMLASELDERDSQIIRKITRGLAG